MSEKKKAEGGDRDINMPKEGDRVKTGLGGRKMRREDVERTGLKKGDKVLCIDPDSEMQLNEETEMLRTVRENTVTRIALNGIRTEKTAHNYLRDDGVWSYAEDEE